MDDTSLVIYHGRCMDGFCAAWIARKFFLDRGVQPKMFAADHDGTLPPDVSGREVYILDFSYKPDQMRQLYKEAAYLTVLDHHKTALESLRDVKLGPGVYFDTERSGAGMAWDYFFIGKRPWLVDYVEDRDLWRFALPNSHEVNAYIGTLPFDFDVWDSLDVGISFAVEHGKTVLAKVRKYCEQMILEARPVDFQGYTVPVVNAPVTDVSELLDLLIRREFAPAGGFPVFSIAWRQRKDLRFEYSLRSVGSFDVSAIAKLYGGGGHPNAAGFTTATRIV